jgi:cysteine synthase
MESIPSTEEEILSRTIAQCREKNIILPTFSEMANPSLMPSELQEKLSSLSIWELNPLNLFRINWKNTPVADPQHEGKLFSKVNYLSLPSSLTGTKAKILILIGKYFPTGSHKVGASYGPLIKRITTGQFDPTKQKAIWPSTGNYCRGGAYDSFLLGYGSIAILPEQMSPERFQWLRKMDTEIFATHGCESNVKEIFDKAKELVRERGDKVICFNQFEDFGNPLWHYNITGKAMEETFGYEKEINSNLKLSAVFLTQGSAGTIASGDYIKKQFPSVKIGAGESLQCPTMLLNGFGGHRIEGIGDKHIPWVFNVRNIDMAVAIDDIPNINIMRLFNEPEGKKYLLKKGVDSEIVEKLSLLGISSIANIMGAIKMAKYYEMTENDAVITVATDSMEMYQSKIAEQRELNGEFTETDAAISYAADLHGLNIEFMEELSYYQKKRIHNLKYFTWIEQQGKEVEELERQWYDHENYWKDKLDQAEFWDKKIVEFNERVGLISQYKK